MSRIFWVQDNGRWMIGTDIHFELPPDRIVEVHTKKQGYKKLKLAVEPSCKSFDRYGTPILLWGMTDLATAHGKRIKRHQTGSGGVRLKGRLS